MILERDGAKIAIDAPLPHTGDGELLLCLHAGVADSRMWTATRRLCALRMAAFDRRGFGRTEVTSTQPWWAAQDTLAVLDALGAERAVLVGCSQGGRVAIDTALQAPERVSQLVLVATAVSGAPEPGPFEGELGELERAMEAAEAAGQHELLNQLEARTWLDGPFTPGRVGEPLRSLFLEMNGLALSNQAPAAQTLPAAWDRLESLTMPVHLLVGELDLPYLLERGELMARRIPGATLTRWPDVAHLPPMEQPERFARWLEELTRYPR